MATYPETATARGWLILSNGVDTWEIPCEDWEWDSKAKPEIDDLPADTRTGFDLGYISRIVKIIRAHFSSRDDDDGDHGINDFIKDMEDWNVDEPFDLQIEVHGDGRHIHFGNTGSTMKVLFLRKFGITKIGHGDVQEYVIKQIHFIQAE